MSPQHQPKFWWPHNGSLQMYSIHLYSKYFILPLQLFFPQFTMWKFLLYLCNYAASSLFFALPCLHSNISKKPTRTCLKSVNLWSLYGWWKQEISKMMTLIILSLNVMLFHLQLFYTSRCTKVTGWMSTNRWMNTFQHLSSAANNYVGTHKKRLQLTAVMDAFMHLHERTAAWVRFKLTPTFAVDLNSQKSLQLQWISSCTLINTMSSLHHISFDCQHFLPAAITTAAFTFFACHQLQW